MELTLFQECIKYIQVLCLTCRPQPPLLDPAETGHHSVPTRSSSTRRVIQRVQQGAASHTHWAAPTRGFPACRANEMLQYLPVGLHCPEKVWRSWGAPVCSRGAAPAKVCVEPAKFCGTHVQDCPFQRKCRDRGAHAHGAGPPQESVELAKLCSADAQGCPVWSAAVCSQWREQK